MSSTELLYQGILPSLPQYMVRVLCWVIYAKFFNFFFYLVKKAETQLPISSSKIFLIEKVDVWILRQLLKHQTAQLSLPQNEAAVWSLTFSRF